MQINPVVKSGRSLRQALYVCVRLDGSHELNHSHIKPEKLVYL